MSLVHLVIMTTKIHSGETGQVQSMSTHSTMGRSMHLCVYLEAVYKQKINCILAVDPIVSF